MDQDSFLAGIHYRISLDQLFTTQEVDEFIGLYQNQSTTEFEIHSFFGSVQESGTPRDSSGVGFPV